MGFEELRDGLRDLRPSGDLVDNFGVLRWVDSTHRLARRVVRDYAEQDLTSPELLLVAWEQVGGRGRRGRRWISPPGAGVYVSWVVARRSQAQCARLPLQVSVGLATALSDVLPDNGCRIKWPNDLVTAQGKLGGILIETVPSPEGSRVALVGFGVNRGVSGGEEPAAGATSLWRELGEQPPGLAKLTWKLVQAVAREIHGNEEELVERYRKLSVHEVGQSLTCRMGEETVRGTFRGFDDRGFLRLERDGRVQTVAAGEMIE